MAKFVDFYSDREIQDIMDAFIQKFPKMFEGFDPTKIGFVVTRKKRSRKPLKIRRVSYPMSVWNPKAYIVEAFEASWKKLNQKTKNLHVWRVMCSIPVGGFDEQSKAYGKVLKPDINIFMREFAATGGVPNWEENPLASDPMEKTAEELAKVIPEVVPEE